MNDTNTPIDDISEDSGNGNFIILLLIVASVWVASWLLIWKFIPKWEDRGTFGDMFGAVNAFFSGAALAGVIYTIALQRHELRLQRRELQMTREELRRSAATQEKSEAALNEQARILEHTAKLNALNFIPAINFSIGDGERANFSMSNVGGTPAYDVDILAIGYYDEQDISPEDFVDHFIKKPCNQINRVLEADDGFFGIYDHTVYAVVPQRRRIRDIFQFPMLPDGMYILLQYRDIQGNNYHQLYWVFKKMTEGSAKTYYIGDLQPKSPTSTARIDYDSELNLKTVDGTELPAYFNDFISHWDTSVSGGYTSNDIVVVEDRGTWNDI